VTTKYFWKRWVPKLGPLPACLLLRLRSYCYFNRATGEKRDWCYPSQETLGAELGVHDETIRIALQKLEKFGFVRREKQYRYDATSRRAVRTTDKYFILMEDPIAPEDEPQAFVLAAERILADTRVDHENRGSRPKAENPPYGEQPVENSAPKAEIPPYYAGGKSARKSDLEELLTKNVNVATHAKERLLQTRDLAEQMLEQLGDRHSMGFYRKVAQRLPDQLVYRALSETKEARHEGHVSNPGAYFTSRIKQLAAERGIKL
jgi:Helix-turn-helix domain